MFSVGITFSVTKLFLAIITAFGMLFNSLFGLPERFVPVEKPEKEVICEMMTLSDNGQCDYTVVYGSGATDLTAANYLCEYLNRIGSLNLVPVRDTDVNPSAHEILVGTTNREGRGYTVDRASMGSDRVLIKTVDEKLVLTGGGGRGTVYSVFVFLEKYLGCRWFTDSLIIVPESQKIEIPRAISYTHDSPFEYRETDWTSRSTLFGIANQMSSTSYRPLPENVGGGIGYTGGFCHTLTNSFVNDAVYFDSKPELYALRYDDSGKAYRCPDQLCLTNPETLSIIKDEVRTLLAANPNAAIVSLTQHDNQHYCQCDNCAALDAAEGSHAGTMITFVNAVAAEFASQYPNVAFDTFAYQYTRTPPKTVRPLDNVIVRLCSIECCFAHTLDDPECESNVDFCDDIVGWGKICNRLYIWDYTTNYSHFNGPFPDFGVIQGNMQFFEKHNVKGNYEEGNYFGGYFGEFNDLRGYLLAKLLWDPYIDLDTCTREFCEAFYGKEAAPYIIEFIRITTEKTGTDDLLGRSRHMGIYIDMREKGMLDLSGKDIQYIDWLWEDAKNASVEDWQLINIRRSEIQWRYWKAYNRVSEFTLLQSISDRTAVNQEFYDDIKELGINLFNEGGKPLSDNPDLLKFPKDWQE